MSLKDLVDLFKAAAQNPRKAMAGLVQTEDGGYAQRPGGKHCQGRLSAHQNRMRQGIRPAAKWVPSPRPNRSG